MADDVLNDFDTQSGTVDKAVTALPAILKLVSAIDQDAVIKDASGAVRWKQPANSASDRLNMSLRGITIASAAAGGEVYIGYVST